MPRHVADRAPLGQHEVEHAHTADGRRRVVTGPCRVGDEFAVFPDANRRACTRSIDRGDAMRSEVFEIRYPDGDFEIAATQIDRLPVAGDRIRRKDRLWQVTYTEGRRPVLVHVELAGDQSPRGTTGERHGGRDRDSPTP